jgi:FKBP-type peptidyl-prolyl cis-trans isomerase/CpeT/CpcT family (DUF1001)
MAQAELTSESLESVSLDNSIQQIADQLSGTWMTNTPFQSIENEDGSTTDQFMTMSIAQVEIDGMENTMYTESALSDSPWSPFRHAIFQLYTYKGKVRLRTYTISMPEDSLKLLSGMTGAPEYFTGVTQDQLIATLDVELESTGSGFTGSTPYPYPTGIGGAVEMTSSVTFDGTTLTTADRGYDADGQVVWGAGEDSSYQFVKTESYIVASEREDGLVIMDYPASQSDMVVQERDEMHVHYYGFLTDGTIFDTSYSRGVPYSFVYPPGNRAIVGWGDGMEALSAGAHRKLIIPGDLGYGPGGNPRAKIPGDSTLVFNVFLEKLNRPEPSGDAGTGESSKSAIKGSVQPGHEGHDHD